MLLTLKHAFSIPEIKKRLLYTLFMIVIFRLGGSIAVPFLDLSVIKEWINKSANNGNFLDYLNTITGGSLAKASIFSLSITPYINASIIMQLLTYALPPLERLYDEGDEGRKKLNKITAIVSMALSLFMGIAYYLTLKRGANAIKYTIGWKLYFTSIIIIASFVAGSSLVAWMGNRISENGIGNGISMILFAGIVARCPIDATRLFTYIKEDPSKYFFVTLGYIAFIVFEFGFIVFMNEADRRVPIQYSHRIVGRKQYRGQKTHIPIKVVMSGVMPIIFAMSFMSIPQTIEMFIGFPKNTDGFYYHFCNFFRQTSWTYIVLYFILIIAFNYFYVSLQYNPVEIANNLRQSNGCIPGIRPGKPTSEYIQRILSRITFVGAIFLGIIAVIPLLFGMLDEKLIPLSMGGTTMLIAVSVALETTRTLKSHLMMKLHKGFLIEKV